MIRYVSPVKRKEAVEKPRVVFTKGKDAERWSGMSGWAV